MIADTSMRQFTPDDTHVPSVTGPVDPVLVSVIASAARISLGRNVRVTRIARRNAQAPRMIIRQGRLLIHIQANSSVLDEQHGLSDLPSEIISLILSAAVSTVVAEAQETCLRIQRKPSGETRATQVGSGQRSINVVAHGVDDTATPNITADTLHVLLTAALMTLPGTTHPAPVRYWKQLPGRAWAGQGRVALMDTHRLPILFS
ncbi:MAG: hypothetical protein HC837_13355 [Chloroflexaceae bacterium]|nr:hypothetical protein [Chloroflexaceae bacterium]